MRRLYRKTEATRQVSLENRVDSLERRYIVEPPCCEMPMAWGLTDGFEMEDDTGYVLSCLSTGFANVNNGIADEINIVNDPGDLTFYVNNTPNFCLAVHDDADDALYQITALVDFAADFTGKVLLFADTTFDIWEPLGVAVSGDLAWEKAWPQAYDFGAPMIAGTAYLSPSTTLQNMISVVAQQISGSTQTVNQAWVMVTKLCPIDPTRRTYTP